MRPASMQTKRSASASVSLHRKDWDCSTSVAKPLMGYSSLKDRSLASFFGKDQTRRQLVGAGLITEDGRIVHLNRGFSRVVVAEHQFEKAEGEEELRGLQEYHLRKQLLARTAVSKEKMEKDNRVNKSRLQEHKALVKRKQERESIYAKCHIGPEYASERRRSVFRGAVGDEKRSYRMDWKRLNKVGPSKVVVTTTVRPASAEDHSDDDSYSASSRSTSSASSRSRSPQSSRSPSPSSASERSQSHDRTDDYHRSRSASSSSSSRRSASP